MNKQKTKRIGALVVCYVHGGHTFPAELAHTHHKIPRAARGTDDRNNLVNVCPTCHGAIDRGATMLVKGQGGRCQSLIEQYLPSNLEAQLRLKELIVIETRSWQSGEHRDKRPLTIWIDSNIHKQLKSLAHIELNPKTKKHFSMTGLVEIILLDYLKKLAQKGQIEMEIRSTKYYTRKG